MEKQLSIINEKIELLSKDPHFQYGYEKFKSSGIIADINNLAGIMLKPESFISGKAISIVNFYVNSGFRVINFKKIIISKNDLLCFYFYPLHSATIERLELLELWATNNYFIFILLENKNYDNRFASSSTYATILKGHSNKDKVDKNSLRFKLCKPIGILNYLHTSDESIDLIRDISIVLDKSELNNLTHWLQNTDNKDAELIDEINKLKPQNIISEFTYENSIENIKVLLQDINTESFNLKLKELENTGQWSVFFTYLESLNINVTYWDKIIISSANVKLYRYESKPRVPSIISYLD